MKTMQKLSCLLSKRSLSGAVLALVLAVLILLNTAVALLPYQFTQLDMTKTGLYSVSSVTKTFLRSLEEDVTIYCITENGAESDQLSPILSRFTAESGRIHVQYVAASDTAFAERYGISDMTQVTAASLVVASAKRYRFIDYTDLLYYYTEYTGRISASEYTEYYNTYSTIAASYPTLADTYFEEYCGFSFADFQLFFDGDSKITNAIEAVTRDTAAYTIPLSENAEAFLRAVDVPVTVYCVFSEKTTECELWSLLDRIDELNPNIKVQFLNPDDVGDAEVLAVYFPDSTPSDLTLIFQSEYRYDTVEWADALSYTHATLGTLSSAMYNYLLSLENAYYQMLQSYGMPYGYCYSIYRLMQTYGEDFQNHTDEMFDLLDVVTYFSGVESYLDAMDFVTQATVPHPYLVTGNGSAGLCDALTEALVTANTELGTLSLSEAIPADAAALFLICPTEDLTEAEAQRLCDFLDNGGNLLLVTSPEYTDLPRLCSVCERFGLSVLSGTVADKDTAYLYSETDTDLLPTVNSAHQINYYGAVAGYEFRMPNSHALAVAEELPENVTVTRLAESSVKAVLRTAEGETSNYTEDEDGNPVAASYLLAACAENAKTGATLIWYASADAVTQALCADETDSNGDGVADCGNVYYFTFAATYLEQEYTPIHKTETAVTMDSIDADRMTVRSAEMTTEPLRVSGAAVIVLGLLMAVGIPVTLITVGAVLYHRRRKS